MADDRAIDPAGAIRSGNTVLQLFHWMAARIRPRVTSAALPKFDLMAPATLFC
jgi:hypothetical protein